MLQIRIRYRTVFWLAVAMAALFCLVGRPEGQTLSQAPRVNVSDEGVLQGSSRSLNFVGAGVTSAIVAGDAVITIAGAVGGSSSLTEIEIDFGAPPCGTVDIGSLSSPDHCQTTITDATVTGTSKIIAFQAGAASTSGPGRDQDENEMDQFVCNANPGTGSFVLYCRGVDDQPLYGKFKVWYLVTI